MRLFLALSISLLTFGLTSFQAIAQHNIPLQDSHSAIFDDEEGWTPLSWNTHVSAADVHDTLSDAEKERLAPELQRVVAAQRIDPGWQLPEQTAHPSVAESETGGPSIRLIIYTTSPASLAIPGLEIGSEFSDFVTARLPLAGLSHLTESEAVTYAKIAQVHEPDHVESIADTRAHLLHNGVIDNTQYQGMGAAVCIIDTGIDFSHEDFIDEEGNTRLLYLWDQRLDAESGERSPAGFLDGVEYDREDLNASIQRRFSGPVRHVDDSGHGTHVAGSAAGNGRTLHGTFSGMAPMADIIVVNVTEEGSTGTATTNLIEGVEYCFRKADEYNVPMAVNVSFGNTRGPKDGTEPFSRAIDELTAQETGRLVTVSAGNAGNNNMHTSTTASAGQSTTVEFDVPPVEADGSTGNWVHIDGWHSTGSDITIDVISPPIYDTNDDGSPDSSHVISLDPGDVEELTRAGLGTLEISHHVPGTLGGGDLNTAFRLRPTSSGTFADGRWTLRINNHSSESVTFHGWLRTAGDLSDAEWTNGDNWYTLNRNATGRHSLAVGNYTVRNSWYSTDGSHYRFRSLERKRVSPSSSRGPTRDERLGLDLIAPGSAITAPLSRDASTSRPSSRILPGRNYLVLTGTSMSAPHAAGGAALLFAEDPSLSADEIHRVLTESTRQDEFTSDERRTGHGKMDIYNAMMMLRHTDPEPITRLNTTTSATTSTRVDNRPHAVRFTPEHNGVVTNLYLQTNREEDERSAIEGSGDLLYLLFSDDGGTPGEPITDTLRTPVEALIPQARVAFNMWKAISTDLQVTAGEPYHLVFFTDEEDASIRASAGPPVGDSEAYVATGSDGTSWQSLQDNLHSDSPLVLDVTAEITTATDHTILPVKLLAFHATQDDHRVRLEWQTGGEQNNEGFSIQHAFEDGSFTEKDFVDGAGTTDVQESYVYETDELNVGLHRFKLKQLNFDGTFITSREIRIRIQLDGTHALASPYPNPSENHARFDVSVAEDQHITARIYDILGREVDTVLNDEVAAETTHTYSIESYRLASGQYVLYLEGEKFTDQAVFTIVR